MSYSKPISTNIDSLGESELQTSSSLMSKLAKRNPLANVETLKEGAKEVLAVVNKIFDIVKPITLAHIICEMLGHTSKWTLLRCTTQLLELYKGPLITHWRYIVDAIKTLAALVSRKDGDSVQEQEEEEDDCAPCRKPVGRSLKAKDKVVIPVSDPEGAAGGEGASASFGPPDDEATTATQRKVFQNLVDKAGEMVAEFKKKTRVERPSEPTLRYTPGFLGATDDEDKPVKLCIDTEDADLKNYALLVLTEAKNAGAEFELVTPVEADLFVNPLGFVSRDQATADVAAISDMKGNRTVFFFSGDHPKLDDVKHEARIHLFGWKVVAGLMVPGKQNAAQTQSLCDYLGHGGRAGTCVADFHDGGSTLQESVMNALKGAYKWSVETMVGWVGAMLAGLVAIASLFPENRLAKKAADRFLALASNAGKMHSAADDSLYAYESVKKALETTLAPASTLPLKDAHTFVADIKLMIQKKPHLLVHPGFPISSVNNLYEYAATKAGKGKGIGAKCWADIMTDCCTIQQCHRERYKLHSTRPMPVVVCLAGPPGVGKTTVVRQIADEINEIFGTVGYDAWQCGLDHQDQTAGRPVMTMEEFGMNDLAADQRALQRLADTNPFVTDNDLIHNKGRHEAPAVIIVTTNCRDIFNDFPHPDALARRISHHVLVENAGLEAWKTRHPGRVPTDEKYKRIFSQTQSTYQKLPSGACDWDGSYLSEGAVRQDTPRAVQLDTLVRDVKRVVKNRWRLVLEDQTDLPESLQFHELKDVPVIVFRGPPGCGKSTMADILSDQFEVTHDSWTDENRFATMVKHVLHLEEETGATPLIITTNITPWEAALKRLGAEERRAFERRLRYFDFSFRKRNLFTTFSHKDMATEGWSKIVDVVDSEKVHYTHTTLLEEIRSLAPKPKAHSESVAPVQTEAYQLAAETNMTVAQVGAGSDPLKTLLSFERHSVPGLNMVTTLAGVMKQISLQGKTKTHPPALVCSVNDAKIKAKVPPCSVKFSDATINFWSHQGFLRCALVDDVPTPTKDVKFTLNPGVDPFEFDHIAETGYELPSELCGALLNVMTTVLGAVALTMEARVRFHTPTEDDEKGPNRRITRVYKPPRDSDFRPTGRNWADDTREMDYTERVVFDSNNWIVPCFDAAGSPKGWAVSTEQGLIANRHVIAGATKIGHQRLGDCVILNYGETDLCSIRPVRNPYQKCRAPFSRPVVGEMVYQLRPNGSQKARVAAFTRVVSPSGRHVEMCLVEGGTSEPGDCGLPWVRRVGTSIELVGIAAGTYGERLMVVPLREDPDAARFHSRSHNYTFLHRTQYGGIVEDSKGLAPSDKVWNGQGEEGMLRHCSEVFFSRAASNAVSPAAVASAVEYVNRLVPEKHKERWGVLATVRSLDMTTAAGPSYNTAKQNVFNEEGVPYPYHSKTFWRGVNNPCTARCQISLKDELRPQSKRDLGLSRPIFCFDVHDTVRVKSMIGAGLQRLADTCGSHIWSVGISQQNGSWAEVCQRLSKWRYAMDADFGRWDSTNSHALLRQAAEVLSALAPPEHREEVMEDLKRLVSAETQFGPTLAGLPSGLVCTAQMNCTSHLLTINDILIAKGRAPVGFMGCPLDFVSYGDDIVLAMDDPQVATWLTEGWKERGFQATNAAKTGPPALGKLDSVSFIKRRFVRVDGEWRAPLDEVSIWKGLSWLRGHTSYNHDSGVMTSELVGTRAVSVFQSVMSEFWQHGREVYELAKRRIIGFARDNQIRLPVCIPEYNRFCPREVLSEYNRDLGGGSVKMLSVAWHAGGDDVQPVSQAEAPGGENVGGVIGMPAIASGLAHQTAGIETAIATSGGPTVQLDPAIRERFVMIPGGMISVRTNMNRGSVVWRKKVSPSMNPWTNLLSTMYNAWCGGFEVMVVVGSNNFIGGKFLVVYLPPNVAAASYSLEQVTAFPHAVLDIRVMDNVMLACSDIKYVLWHPTNAAPDDPIGTAGEVVIYLLTNIITAGNSGNVMTLDMSLFSRPLPEFDFNFIMPVNTGGKGGPADVEMQRVASALSTPATGAGRGWHVVDLFVAAQAASSLSGDIFATTVRMSGTSPYCIPYPAADGMLVNVVKVSTTSYKLVCFNPDGSKWDIGADGASQSLPPYWMAFNSDKNHTILTWLETSGTWNHAVGAMKQDSAKSQPTFVPNAASEIPVNTPVAVTGTKDGTALLSRDGPGTAPTFSPNNGESIIFFPALSKLKPAGMVLATQEMVRAFVETPRVTAMCGLFNVSDASGATTVQAKLYPNGVLTTGTAPTAIYYTGPITFEYVGMVPVDYKLQSPVGGTSAGVLDLVDRLDKWLELQQQLEPGSSLASSTQQLRSASQEFIRRPLLKSKLEILDSDEESFESILKP
ncbi:polyprotein [Ameiurus nebulosus calicivirus 1]|nr:polyprotein [Ameiurus nebulosus calicivirus 1]